MVQEYAKFDAFKFDYGTTIDACYSGALRPPTRKSLGIAVRPNANSTKPQMKLYFQPDLMKFAGFYIGNYLDITFTDTATHIRIEVVEKGAGVKLQPAANNDSCIEYGQKLMGTQKRGRCAQVVSDEFMRAFKFDDKCNVFVEPYYVRKGKYIIAPLDDMPIFPAKRGSKTEHTLPEHR